MALVGTNEPNETRASKDSDGYKQGSRATASARSPPFAARSSHHLYVAGPTSGRGAAYRRADARSLGVGFVASAAIGPRGPSTSRALPPRPRSERRARPRGPRALGPASSGAEGRRFKSCRVALQALLGEVMPGGAGRAPGPLRSAGAAPSRAAVAVPGPVCNTASLAKSWSFASAACSPREICIWLSPMIRAISDCERPW